MRALPSAHGHRNRFGLWPIRPSVLNSNRLEPERSKRVANVPDGENTRIYRSCALATNERPAASIARPEIRPNVASSSTPPSPIDTSIVPRLRGERPDCTDIDRSNDSRSTTTPTVATRTDRWLRIGLDSAPLNAGENSAIKSLRRTARPLRAAPTAGVSPVAATPRCRRRQTPDRVSPT